MEYDHPQESGAEEIFGQLARAGDRKRDQEAERLANAFITGAERLAKQRDPFATFQKLVNAAAKVDAQKLDDAHRQFERYFDPTVGSEEASSGFDVLVGAQMFKLDPDKFLEALLRSILANLPKENIEFSDNRILKLKPIELRNNILPYKPFKYIKRDSNPEIIEKKLINFPLISKVEWNNENPIRILLFPNFNGPFITKPVNNEIKDSDLGSFRLDPDYFKNLSKKTDIFVNKKINLRYDPETGKFVLGDEPKQPKQ